MKKARDLYTISASQMDVIVIVIVICSQVVAFAFCHEIHIRDWCIHHHQYASTGAIMAVLP